MGFFRLQPPHPLCTEEVGSNLINLSSETPCQPAANLEAMGCSGFSLRTLTVQKRLVELSQSSQTPWQPAAKWRPWAVQASASAHSQYRRGWWNSVNPQRYPGSPQPFRGHGLFRLQPPHPHSTEEVGGIKSIFRDTLAARSQMETMGCSGLSLRTLTAQKRLVELSQSSETPWQPSANWRPWAVQASASAHSPHRRGWWNQVNLHKHPGSPQPIRDHGLFRLKPSHTHRREEVGGIRLIFRDTLPSAN
jgi:hypothetical protein